MNKEVSPASEKGLFGKLVKSNFMALSMLGIACYFIVLYAHEYSNTIGIVYA